MSDKPEYDEFVDLDKFACFALMGLLSETSTSGGYGSISPQVPEAEILAKDAYHIAHTMMEERKKYRNIGRRENRNKS